MEDLYNIWTFINTKKSSSMPLLEIPIEEAEKCGHEIDLINLFDAEQLSFYNQI